MRKALFYRTLKEFKNKVVYLYKFNIKIFKMSKLKTKPRLKKSVNLVGTFIKLPEEFKKEAKIYAVQKGLSFTSLIIEAINEKIQREG